MRKTGKAGGTLKRASDSSPISCEGSGEVRLEENQPHPLMNFQVESEIVIGTIGQIHRPAPIETLL